MFDTHYDLLTELYISYLNHDFSRVDTFCKNFSLHNVSGFIANLCFESEEEMRVAYHEQYYCPEVSVIQMFQIATDLAREKVPKEVSMLFAIEGCDKVELDDLKPLYDLGLRVIAPVWNEPNQYGSGIRGDGGLTQKGEELLSFATTLGIAIDLSHANEKTFYDSIRFLESLRMNGQNPVFFASHSNVRKFCDRERNLTDEQIKKLANAGGKIGIFSNANFIYPKSLQKNISNHELKHHYVQHIMHVLNLTSNVDFVMLSTDDMAWAAPYTNDWDYTKLNIFSYECLYQEIFELLQSYEIDEVVIQKLMFQNAYDLLLPFIQPLESEKNYEN